MAASYRPQIINLSYNGGDGHLSFRLFPKLPTELRVRIWELSLERHRLLELNIEPQHDSEEVPLYSARNALNNVISGRNYSVTVKGLAIYSKLLRVNREARRAALRFYRVHIPCYFQTSEEKRFHYPGTIPGTLYCNPEYDFLQLNTGGIAEHTLVDFLHDFRAKDRRHVGVVNLAFDINGMNFLRSMENIPHALARASFAETLSRLQQIIWVAHSHAGRAIIGPLQDFWGVGVRFIHAMPVKAATASFDLLDRDPRAIDAELQYVLTATSDPRHMRVWWRELLARWEIHQARPTKERVLFAYEPIYYLEKEVRDVESAIEFLEEERQKWFTAQRDLAAMFKRHEPEVLAEGLDTFGKAVKPAIGFWLFPAEALGSLDGDIPDSKVRYDMTGYWPELALSCLS
ncbi:2EXR domain-containing protein [Madurella fahalii]|uniref:2EXR domain-containing protein n=1 Tax=Madurella fahalii TaxID=1157608 RepID=A0ABQ0GGU3_9PEZI